MNPKLKELINKYGLEERDDLQDFFHEVNNSFNSNEMLKTVLDSTPCTVSWINKDLKYEGVNQMLQDQMGLDYESFEGNSLGDLTKDSTFLNFAQEVFNSKEKTLTQPLDVVINNKKKYFHVIGKKYKKNEKAVIIGLDLTEYKQMEQQNILSEKLTTLGEMSASIIHEINNPLNIISMLAERISYLLDDDETDYDKVKDSSIKISETVDKISKIITSLKNLSRNSNTEDIKIHDVKELIEQSTIASSAKVKHSHVNFQLDKNITGRVLANEVQLYQVIVNLINNSCDAIKDNDKKWIKVFTKEENNYIKIFIQDSGSGIPKETQKTLFDPFFSTKPIGEGTGLGLSISKKIIDNHNGSLIVDNNFKNTTFVISLPKS